MTEVTRGEFDLLHEMVVANQQRIEGISVLGAVQVQLTEVAKDLIDLKADVNKRFDAHQLVHEGDQAQRVAARRWQIGTVIAVLALLITIVGLVLHRPA